MPIEKEKEMIRAISFSIGMAFSPSIMILAGWIGVANEFLPHVLVIIAFFSFIWGTWNYLRD